MAYGSEVTELITIIRKTGHKVTKTGNSKHYKVLRPNGAVVVDANGPIIISSSPSVNRWREMAVQRLMNPDIPGGPVLKSDPFKPTPSGGGKGEATPKQKGGGSRGTITDEMREKSAAATKAKTKRNEERTGKIRARWEPILAKLGGWQRVQNGSGVSKAEFALVMTSWARNRGRVELPKKTQRGTPMNAGAYNQIVNVFAKGGTLGEQWALLFEIFVDALERESGTPPDPAKSAAKYTEYLREAKGISPGPQSPAAGPPIIPAKPDPDVTASTYSTAPSVTIRPGDTKEIKEGESVRVEIGPLYDPDTYVDAPKLALEALYEMAYSGRFEDRERHLEIATQIAELELNKGGKP